MSLALFAASALRQSGHQVFFVGGSVRDKLLGRAPHDFDLATSATPAQLQALFPNSTLAGAHFGVILLRRDHDEIEIATFRSDNAYSDGRRPESVTFETDPRADALRRDFTVNALLEDPFTGEIIDHVNGRADLAARLIRAIGDPARRFAEDHLRMLRAVRLAASLHFDIEPQTLAAIQAEAHHITRISPERTRDELSRILTEGAARRGFELLHQSGLLAHILPEVAAMQGVAQPPEFHPEGDVWTHTLGLLERLDNPSLPLALAALLHDAGKPATRTFDGRIRFNGHDKAGAALAREILARLRYPNDVIDAVESLISQHMIFNNVPHMTEARFKRFVRQPLIDSLLELHRLDLLAGLRPLNSHASVLARRAAIPADKLRPAPLLSGRDLIQLGYTPGPRFAQVLHQLEDQQLEGAITTRDQALAFVTLAWAQASTSTPPAAPDPHSPRQPSSSRPS